MIAYRSKTSQFQWGYAECVIRLCHFQRGGAIPSAVGAQRRITCTETETGLAWTAREPMHRPPSLHSPWCVLVLALCVPHHIWVEVSGTDF